MNFKSNITSNGFINKTDYGYYKIYYLNLEKYYLSWYLPITIIVGVIGGIVCTTFLIISKIFPKNVLIWMISICIGDLMILLFDSLRMLLKIWSGFDIRDFSNVICKLHNFFSNYFMYWSGYMQMCMSIQRLICVLKPLQSRGIFTNKLVFSIWISVSLLLVGPMLPYLLYWEVSEEKEGKDCSPSDSNLYTIITILDIVIWGIIPLLTMITSTIGISFVVFKSTSEVGNLSPQSQSINLVNKKSRRHGQLINERAWQVTRLLMCMNILYFISNFPLLIYQIYLNAGGNKVNKSMPQQLHKTIYYTLRSICYLSSSWNWVFYCVGGHQFRVRATQILQRLNVFRKPLTQTETQTKTINLSM